MATDVFPVYELLVESIFGGVGLSLVGVAFAMVIILALTRTSQVFMVYWMFFYLSVALVLYLGGIGWILMFIFTASYMVWNIAKTFNPADN